MDIVTEYLQYHWIVKPNSHQGKTFFHVCRLFCFSWSLTFLWCVHTARHLYRQNVYVTQLNLCLSGSNSIQPIFCLSGSVNTPLHLKRMPSDCIVQNLKGVFHFKEASKSSPHSHTKSHMLNKIMCEYLFITPYWSSLQVHGDLNKTMCGCMFIFL